mmetsp:Transcript_115947/g.368741  ORF Transcript_115947/g.368741 Transcript_115947/m.368741 type:complete len:271 (+) Transcript_115947:882-1694(+)
MVNSGMQPDVDHMNYMIAVAGQAGDYDKAMRMFAQLRGLGMLPDKGSYSSVILACMKADRRDMVWDLMDKSMEAGLYLGADTYSELFEYAQKGEDRRRAVLIAQEWLDGEAEVDRKGVSQMDRVVDLNVLHQALACCAEEGFVGSAMALFVGVQKWAPLPAARAQAYRSVIAACRKVGGHEVRMLTLLKDMQKYGIIISDEELAAAYRGAIQQTAKDGQAEPCYQILMEMERLKLPVDREVLETVARASELARQRDRAKRLRVQAAKLAG